MSSGKQRATSVVNDERLSLAALKKLPKVTLRAKAASYGLSQTGKKEPLANRIYRHLHSTEEVTGVSISGESSDSDDEAPLLSLRTREPMNAAPASTNTSSSLVTLSLGDLKALFREVNPSTPLQPSSAAYSTLQLSPASTTVPQVPYVQPNLQLAPQQSQSPVPGVTPTADPPLPPTIHSSVPIPADSATTTAIPRHQGNFASLFSSPVSNLPPLSPKLMKSMKEKEYVDLNTLLPTSLYDTLASPSFSLKLQPGSHGDESVSLTQTRRSLQKISTFDNWLEAWNIFIRSMVNFHPHLAAELLAYQESFCSLNRSYAFQACYRYDIAFRMNIARNHFLSWARLDEYAFNKFLRCSPPAPATSQYHCYRCRSTGHFAANCPYQLNSAPKQNFRPSQGPNQAPCRHFNNSQSCRDQNCPWQHICNRCGGQHPGSSCPTLKRQF